VTTTDLSAIVCRLIQDDPWRAETAAAALLQQQFREEGAHPDDSIFLSDEFRELADAAAVDAKARQALAAHRIAEILLIAVNAKNSPVLPFLQEYITADLEGLLECFAQHQEVAA
jgi:hypothetical protein